MSRLLRRCARNIRGREHVIAISIMGITMGAFLASLLFSQFNPKTTSRPITQTQELSPTPTHTDHPTEKDTKNLENTRFARAGESTLTGEEATILPEEYVTPIDQEQMGPLFPLDPLEESKPLRFDFPDALSNPALDPALQSRDYANVPQVPEPTPGLLVLLGLCGFTQLQGRRLPSSMTNT